MIVGEGGIYPTYFLDSMQWWEVNRFIAGIRRRERTPWVTTRWLGWMVSRMMGGKSESPEELMQMPWEKDIIDPDQEEKDIQALLEECRAQNAKVNP